MRNIDPQAIERLPQEQQKEARELLAALQHKYEQNPLLRYEPHPKQVAFHESRALTKAFMGGNRSGKTTAGIVDDLIQACDREAVPGHLRAYKKFEPPFHGRIVCPSEKIMESVIFQKLREWAPKDQLVGGEWSKAFSKSSRILSFKNGSFFDFLTYEQDVDKHSGAAKHRIHFDEEPPFDIRQENRMRLIDYKGADEIFTMTPLLGMTWMHDTIWTPWEKGQLKNGFIVVVDMDDNPYLDNEQKRVALAGYSSEELKARKEGRFVHFAGMIYPEFSRMEHVIPCEPIPEGAYVYVGIDPGMRVMAAVVWVYVDGDGRLIVFDELALQGHTIADVAKAIKLINAKHGDIKPRQYVIDPSARNILHQTGRSDQMEFTDNGIYTVLGQNAVPAGISKVKQLLAERKLLIMANCGELIDEFRKYRWATPGRSENDPKEKPIKQDDHLLDALRYVVQARPYGPPPEVEQKRDDPAQRLVQQEIQQLTRPRRARIEGIPF